MEKFEGPRVHPEAAQPSAPDADTIEQQEQEYETVVERQYEDLIRKHHPVDSGQEGLIYKLSPTQVESRARELMLDHGIDLDSDSAVKVLKVFNPGKIEHEYNAQSSAYQVLAQAKETSTKPLAQVPAPFDFRKIHITDETRDILNREGAKIIGNEVEVMMMDFVPGEDLQTIFYRWIVKHAPADKQYAVTVDPDLADFPKLYQAVSGILDFGVIPEERGAQADAEIKSRREKVFNYLKKTGFTMKPGVVEQIKNTREVLQTNRIYHNDEHERNFMLHHDQVYIIDFARASNQELEDEVTFEIDKLLEQLTPGYEQKQKAEVDESLKTRVEGIALDAGLPDRYKAVYRAAETSPIALHGALRARAEAASSTESTVNDFMGLLVRLSREKLVTNSSALEIVDHMKDSLRKPVLKRGRVQGFAVRNPAIYNKIDVYKQLFE